MHAEVVSSFSSFPAYCAACKGLKSEQCVQQVFNSRRVTHTESKAPGIRPQSWIPPLGQSDESEPQSPKRE